MKSNILKTARVTALGAGALTLSSVSFAEEIEVQKKAPNIIFILTDDQGWSQLSKHIDPRIKESKSDYLDTPFMNEIADQGMRFTAGYSPAPVCTPTRRSILCGTATARSGSEFVSRFIPKEHTTIPKMLKKANPNYMTGHFGKWGKFIGSTPKECGYDVDDGIGTNATGGQGQSATAYLVEDPKRTSSVTDNAIDFMQKQVKENKPFFMQVSYFAVHLRVETLEKTLEKYKAKGAPDRQYTAGWAAMLEDLDSGVGRILKSIADLKIGDNTFVVFMSDNGCQNPHVGGDKSRPQTNHPLIGAKQSLNEGGIRVPFFVKGPGIKPNSYCHTPVAGYDLLATFYDFAGGKDPLPSDVDGASIMPLLKDPENGKIKRPLDGLVFHRPCPGGKKGNAGNSVLRTDDYKLIIKWDKTEEGKIVKRQLYNLAESPVENDETLMSDSELTNEMEKTLVNYLKSVNAETPFNVLSKSDGKRRDKKRTEKSR